MGKTNLVINIIAQILKNLACSTLIWRFDLSFFDTLGFNLGFNLLLLKLYCFNLLLFKTSRFDLLLLKLGGLKLTFPQNYCVTKEYFDPCS